MISGIGIDLCKISRISRAIENKAFVERVFSAEEKAYAESSKNPARHYASAFAAKEAFAKAGGWGLSKVGLRSVSVSRLGGAPELHLSEHAKDLLLERNVLRIHLSLSHEDDMAIAVVILEARDDSFL